MSYKISILAAILNLIMAAILDMKHIDNNIVEEMCLLLLLKPFSIH